MHNALKKLLDALPPHDPNLAVHHGVLRDLIKLLIEYEKGKKKPPASF
jgi:hypothetical protein